MITTDDIKLIVGTGEGYNVEFKVSIPSKVRELSEEVCAFAIAINSENRHFCSNIYQTR